MCETMKQNAIAFAIFRDNYRRIESMNVRHDQNENYGGQIYSWKGASDDKIYEAYKKGEQLNRYYE